MPANNFMSNPATLPENGPTLRFMVGFEDMDQQRQGINLAAYRAHGIKMPIVPTIGITATRSTKSLTGCPLATSALARNWLGSSTFWKNPSA